MSGWIKLHRSLQDSAIAAHPEYLAVWVHLMIRAQHSASEFVVGRQIVKLSAGQLVFGRIKFSSEIGVSENKVRAALDVMKNLKMITIKSMAKFSIISITNWSEYQDKSPADDQQTASNAPADDQQTATYKNDKNVNNDKNEENLKDITPQAAPPAAPKKNSKPVQLDYSSWPAMPTEQTMTDWLAMRKRLKANVSQTVINRFASELRKAATFGYTVDQCLAECVTRNWRGFEAQWILNSKQPTGGNHAGQPKPSLIDRFIQNNYGTGHQDDHRPMGGDDSVIRGEVVEPVRGDTGRIGAMAADLIGDFKATGGGGFE